MNWYEVKNADKIDSPALLIYPERVAHNIQTMIETVKGDVSRLMPHVKTHKMPEIIRMQMKFGIRKEWKNRTYVLFEPVFRFGISNLHFNSKATLTLRTCPATGMAVK